MALILREQNIPVESFGLLIRLWHLLKAKYADSGKNAEVKEEEIEALMEAISVFCFNRGMTVPQLGNIALTLYYVADKFGITLYELPTFVQKLTSKAAEIRKAIALQQYREMYLLNHYLITRDVIKDILSNGPYMLQAYLDMKSRLRETENERDEYKNQVKSLKIELRVKEIEAEKKFTESQSKIKVLSN